MLTIGVKKFIDDMVQNTLNFQENVQILKENETGDRNRPEAKETRGTKEDTEA